MPLLFPAVVLLAPPVVFGADDVALEPSLLYVRSVPPVAAVAAVPAATAPPAVEAGSAV